MKTWIVCVLLVVFCTLPALAQTPDERIAALEAKITQLEQRIADLEAKISALPPAPAKTVTDAPPVSITTGSASSPISEINTVFMVVEYQDTIIPDNKYHQPKDGMKIIGIRVVLDNTAGTEVLKVNPLFVKVKDSEGTQFTANSVDLIKPGLEMSDVEIGDLLKGWVSFIVPEQTELLRMKVRYESFTEKSGWVSLADIGK